MRNFLKVFLVGFLVLGMALPGFAQGRKQPGQNTAKAATNVFRGKIVSINAAKNEIVVAHKKTGADRTVSVRADLISSLKVGDHVRVKIQNNGPADVKVIKGKQRKRK